MYNVKGKFWRFTTFVKVVEAEKRLFPEKVLLSINRVEEAAVWVPDPMQAPPLYVMQPEVKLIPFENDDVAPPPCVMAP